MFCKSATYEGRCKNFAKKCFADLVGMEKSSTFAPAIERDAAVIEILKVKLGSSNHSKKLFEKKLRKSLVVINKVLTFASAFENDSNKEEFFERFRYEQASSTILT